MNGFSFGDGTIPDPLTDIPVPAIPPTDFAAIGQALEDGRQASLAKTLMDVNCGSSTAPLKITSWGGYLGALLSGTFIFCWLQRMLAWFFGAFFKILNWLFQQVFQIFGAATGPMNQLFTTTVSGMMGLSEAGISKGASGLPTQAPDLASSISNKVKSTLAAAASATTSGGIPPSSAGADKFLEMAAHMAIEGWLIGVVADAASVHELEQIGDLKDTLERTLGFGRLSSRALHAPMKIFVEDPYTQLLHQKYLPTLLNPGELVRQYMRKHIDRDTLQSGMSLHGYSNDKVDALIFDQLTQLKPEEIYKGYITDQYDNTTALQLLGVAGYDAATAKIWLDVQDAEYANGLNRKLVQEALALYKAGKFTRARYDTMVGSSGLPTLERDIFGKLADLIDAAHSTPQTQEQKRASLAEGLRMMERNIWNSADYEDLVKYYNYTVGDETALTQLASSETADYQTNLSNRLAAQQARAQKAADRLRHAQMMVEDIGVSTGAMETLVYDGLRSIPQYQQYLRNKNVAEDNVQSLTTALGIKLVTKAAAAAAKIAAANKAKTKQVDLAQLETAVKTGLMTMADFTTRVKALGMSDADAQLLTTELQDSISAASTKAQAVAAAKAQAAIKHVDLAQEERAVRLGISTVADYEAFLTEHAFAPEDAAVLVSELQAQLVTDQATAAKKQAAATKAAAKGISLTQLERLVRAGVKQPADYQAALQAAGVDAADQSAMMEYLQLEMTQDSQDLATKGHASALVGQLGLSLTDLTRAVKLGVLPIAAYTDALSRSGLSAADQATMQGTLADEIKNTAAAKTTAASVSKQVAAAGLSLATLEKDTVDAKISMTQFQSLLAGYGVSDTDIADVAGLVQDQIDNKAAVAALVQGATAAAAAKGLDLAQITAALKAQAITAAEWQSRVSALGYDAADVEILFETLSGAPSAVTATNAPIGTPPIGTAAPAG